MISPNKSNYSNIKILLILLQCKNRYKNEQKNIIKNLSNFRMNRHIFRLLITS